LGKKTVPLTRDGIDKLPDRKPVVYKVLSEDGSNLYTGSAMRGRVRERLCEHLPGGKDPIKGGAKVQIEEQPSVEEAQAKEKRIIKRTKPPQNKRGR